MQHALEGVHDGNGTPVLHQVRLPSSLFSTSSPLASSSIGTFCYVTTLSSQSGMCATFLRLISIVLFCASSAASFFFFAPYVASPLLIWPQLLAAFLLVAFYICK